MICKNCGRELEDYMQYCDICGSPLVPEPEDKKNKGEKGRRSGAKKIPVIIAAACVGVCVIGAGGFLAYKGLHRTPGSGQVHASADRNDYGKKLNTFQPVTMSLGDCTVTFNEIYPDSVNGYTVTALIENSSTDTTYTLQVTEAYANSLGLDCYCYATVEPGKKANTEIQLTTAAKEYLNNDITDLQLFLEIYDDKKYETAAQNDITLYPKGTETHTVYQHKAVTSDEVLLDKNNVKATYIRDYMDESGNHRMVLYLENKTEQTLQFETRNCSVNDYMINPYGYMRLHPEKNAYMVLTFDSVDLKKNNIEQIDSLEFTLQAWDADAGSEKKLADTKVSFSW